MPESVRLVRTRAEALANHPAAIVAGLGALLIALILVASTVGAYPLSLG